jgi:hypothetical protein
VRWIFALKGGNKVMTSTVLDFIVLRSVGPGTFERTRTELRDAMSWSGKWSAKLLFSPQEGQYGQVR